VTSYLVTGGAGFIGSHMVEALVERGECVRVLDDFSTGKRENLAAVTDRIELLEGDVADPATVERAVVGCDYVLHLAAVASVQASLEDPRRTHRVNAGGTLNVLQAARRAGVRRIVFASTTALYGDHTALPLREELPPRPLSPYAASKLAGEAYCRAFHISYGLPTVALRFFNVYGSRQDPSNPYSGVISIFAARMARGKRPTIYGDGKQTRDFVYVADVVRAVLLACECDAAVGGVFNVARGTQMSILQLAAELNQVLGTDLAPTFAPARAGEVRFSQGDASRAQEVLEWAAQVPLQEGLSRLLSAEYGEAEG
jgi:UDP-glucose 4-epimerase